MYTSLCLIFIFGLLCIGLLSIYRLFLSPLAQIPGPKLAAVTRLYEMYYDLVKEGQMPWKLQELHKHHGLLKYLSSAR
jgi:hypothetical protein